MGDKDKESHHGQIIQIKQKDRLFIIQKDKMGLQKHIGQEIPVNKLIESPYRYQRSRDAESGPPRAGIFLYVRRLPDPAHHHIPMQSQMHRHQYEAPVYADYMQQPSKRRAAADIQEIKHMARQQNPADHQSEHRQEQKQADCKLKAARGCIFPFE